MKEKNYERNINGSPIEKWMRYARSLFREKIDVAIVPGPSSGEYL
jgi:hypothetical protein